MPFPLIARSCTEEVDLIQRGLLCFDQAQWVKTEKHRLAINDTVGSMVCKACGTIFSSNRVDSMERHVKKGAWYVYF